MALYEVKVNEWDKTRDYFVALMVSNQISSKEKPVGPAEILADRYQNVKFTPELDPDEGAVWEGAFPAGETEEETDDGY